MIIKKEWRILTVGDGDLSFSNALQRYYQPKQLTATVFDSLQTLQEKYKENAYSSLQQNDVALLFNFDVTDDQSWTTLNKNSFDVVIFQFPLLPAFRSLAEYQSHGKRPCINTLHRTLLRKFLVNSFKHFLDPKGEQLCFITSKDVNPYRQWNLENALHQHSHFYYLGSSLFDISIFPDYKVRNVNRDKHVRDTQGRTYVWSLQAAHSLEQQLDKAGFQGKDCCTICRAGPFSTEQDKKVHNSSKKHVKSLQFEALWAKQLKSMY